MTTSSGYPGNPDAGQIAAAERRHAAVRNIVDELLAMPPVEGRPTAATAIVLAGERVMERVSGLTRRDDDFEELAQWPILLCGELLRRAQGDPR